MKRVLLLIALLFANASAQPAQHEYYIDQLLLLKAYNSLICQQGEDVVRKRLDQDVAIRIRLDQHPNDPGVRDSKHEMLDEVDIKSYLSCLAKFSEAERQAQGNAQARTKPENVFTGSDQKTLIDRLTKPKPCSEDTRILILDPNVVADWIDNRLKKRSPPEKTLRDKLIGPLKVALRTPC